MSDFTNRPTQQTLKQQAEERQAEQDRKLPLASRDPKVRRAAIDKLLAKGFFKDKP